MFATNKYLAAALDSFDKEGTLLNSTRVLTDSNYDMAMRIIPLCNYPKAMSVRMLASWDLPVTLGSMYILPFNALTEAKETLSLLIDGKHIPKKFDGMIAKAIQSLRLHRTLSAGEFITMVPVK